ncbi:MAG: hypothetical protein EG825_10540 [Rhodocyclaceae bacterium]|nr:hypothetical protein [Rhodocyclaceae bacterium]
MGLSRSAVYFSNMNSVVAPAPILSDEDALRLHVLLAGEVHAVRIDESAMVLHALTPKGEARLPLHASGRADAYLTQVRELLGGHALGSPGGYPVHLRRWTRMGQAGAKNLEALLKLGEPEAVLAVAYAPGLTDELARRAWWALPTMEVARVMLIHPEVREGEMGKVLADFLVEHLPFEEDAVTAMNTVRIVLGAGRLDAEERLALWRKGQRRPHYLIGFIEHLPDDLPTEGVASIDTPEPVAADAWSRQWARCCSGPGQAWLRAVELALEKPPAHEAVYLLLQLIGSYFAPVAVQIAPTTTSIPADAAAAMADLARLRAEDAEPVLTRTTAVGPLMRKKLDPLLAPVLQNLRKLRQ